MQIENFSFYKKTEGWPSQALKLKALPPKQARTASYHSSTHLIFEKQQCLSNDPRFATSKSEFGAEQFVVYQELQREEVGEREGAEGEAADEHASRSAARQDGRRARGAETCADAVSSFAEQLH